MRRIRVSLVVVAVLFNLVLAAVMGVATWSEAVPAPVTTTSVPVTTTTVAVRSMPPDTVVLPSTTTTLVPVGLEMQCAEWAELAVTVGWPVEQLPKLGRVLFRESTCRPGAFNGADPFGGSRGLAQINGYWCSSTKYNPGGWLQGRGVIGSCDDLFDPRMNLVAALLIWQRSGWSPWSTA